MEYEDDEDMTEEEWEEFMDYLYSLIEDGEEKAGGVEFDWGQDVGREVLPR